MKSSITTNRTKAHQCHKFRNKMIYMSISHMAWIVCRCSNLLCLGIDAFSSRKKLIAAFFQFFTAVFFLSANFLKINLRGISTILARVLTHMNSTICTINVINFFFKCDNLERFPLRSLLLTICNKCHTHKTQTLARCNFMASRLHA